MRGAGIRGGFANICSFNSELLDPAYSEEHQSHWNGISQAAINFIPCLRLRWIEGSVASTDKTHHVIADIRLNDRWSDEICHGESREESKV
ncbi:hypothetical protein ARMGADRAFT_529465 [Armillaria gallica]|uniref:Uncharacterized protein n=1 Tax=Armillaria gallica TaxID=47427 RepID=A0A2H3D6P8_ARMGA|nr:hypothetical protein ARMGADRAFT_529465 [Armillaria gallica]